MYMRQALGPGLVLGVVFVSLLTGIYQVAEWGIMSPHAVGKDARSRIARISFGMPVTNDIGCVFADLTGCRADRTAAVAGGLTADSIVYNGQPVDVIRAKMGAADIYTYESQFTDISSLLAGEFPILVSKSGTLDPDFIIVGYDSHMRRVLIYNAEAGVHTVPEDSLVSDPDRRVIGASFDRSLYVLWQPFNLIDVGAISAGAPHQAEFVFLNTSRGIIDIENVTTSCGCVEIKSFDRRAGVGEWVNIRAEIRPKVDYTTERFEQRLYIEVGGPKRINVECRIVGLTDSKVNVIPSSLFVGVVDEAGVDLPVRLSVLHPAEGRCEVVVADMDAGVSVNRIRTLDDRSIEVELVLSPSHLRANAEGDFVLRTIIKTHYVSSSGVEHLNEFPVELFGRLGTPLSIFPNSVFIGPTASGVRHSICVGIGGRFADKSVTVSAADDWLDVGPLVDKRFKIDLDAPNVPGIYRSSVIVSAGGSVVRVPVTVYVK
jgi:Protein of unknown function (DUF1573)